MELIKAAIAAYGGEALWSRVKTVNATISSGGFAFLTKFQRALRGHRVEVEASQPRTKLFFDSDGTVGVFDGGAVRMETPEGKLLASRVNARSLFPRGRRQLWWDRLDQLYFVGYALWNYLAFPALLGGKTSRGPPLAIGLWRQAFRRIFRPIAVANAFILTLT